MSHEKVSRDLCVRSRNLKDKGGVGIWIGMQRDEVPKIGNRCLCKEMKGEGERRGIWTLDRDGVDGVGLK